MIHTTPETEGCTLKIDSATCGLRTAPSVGPVSHMNSRRCTKDPMSCFIDGRDIIGAPPWRSQRLSCASLQELAQRLRAPDFLVRVQFHAVRLLLEVAQYAWLQFALTAPFWAGVLALEHCNRNPKQQHHRGIVEHPGECIKAVGVGRARQSSACLVPSPARCVRTHIYRPDQSSSASAR